MKDSSKTVVHIEGVTQKQVDLSLSEVLWLFDCVSFTAEVWPEVGWDCCCIASILDVFVEAHDLGYVGQRTVEANAEADWLSTGCFLIPDVL